LPTLFISDLHLHPSRPATIACFREFLQRQQGQAEALYILGDLFEAWVGDDHPEAVYVQVRAALKECVDAGTPVFVMHGNRDFLIGEAFCQETGCCLIADPTLIDLYGTPTLLMHGDSLCIDDQDYQALRSRLRDPEWQRQALALPLEERIALAQEARELSVLNTQGKDEYIMDVNPEEVLRIVKANRVRLLIHGHTHRPGIHKLDVDHSRATRIVLGDWYQTGSVLTVDGQKRQLDKLACP
jgi:UDP-2,3-diacylglucosamine hydrolase